MASVPKYKMKEQASSLLELALSLPFAKAKVGKEGSWGIRFVFCGYLAIESYTSTEEPVLEPWRGVRLVFWKTLKDVKVPKGWRHFRGIPIGNASAVSLVHKDALRDWASNARRFALWHDRMGTGFVKVSLKEFSKAYQASGYLDPMLRHGFIRVIKDHIRVHPQDVSMLFFYTPEKVFAGGTVFVDYPDLSQSHYLISFLTEAGRKSSSGYAFIHWWYQDMLQKGLVWADFGIIWKKGDPLSWKGYSQFKKRFNPEVHQKVSYWKLG